MKKYKLNKAQDYVLEKVGGEIEIRMTIDRKVYAQRVSEINDGDELIAIFDACITLFNGDALIRNKEKIKIYKEN